MTKTLEAWSREDRTVLVSAEWRCAPGEDLWALLLRVLHALGSMQTVFESVHGWVAVAWRGEPATESQTWPIDALPGGVEALRERVRAGGGASEPSHGELCCDVDLLLPDDISAVEVTDWPSDEERAYVVALPLERRADVTDAPPRLRRWKARSTPGEHSEVAPVSLDLCCDGDERPPIVWIALESQHELWRPWSFDDVPMPGGRDNLERLRRALEVIAAATGGTVSLPAAMVAEVERANGLR